MPPHRLFPPIDPTREGGGRSRSKGVEPRSTLTANGRINLCRRRYADATTPLDAFLDRAEAAVSLGARRFCCLINADSSSFDRAADNLQRTTGIRLSGERLRQVVEQEGRQVLNCCAKGELPCPFNASQDCTVNEVSRMYLGCDGFLASVITDAEKRLRRKRACEKRRRLRRQTPARPLACLPPRKLGANQRYKEFKLVQFYDEHHRHRLVSVTRRDHQAAGRLMRRDGGRAGFFAVREKLAVIDGGPWIINQIKAQSLPVTAVSLDFYHRAENVHRARRTCFGEDDPTGNDWAAGALHIAKHDGYEALRDHLLQWRRGPSVRNSKHRRRACDLLINYVTDRREMINYPQWLQRQWQIGSGPTESQCKLVPKRVKGRGQRWDPDNAEAVMAIETLAQSNLSSVYWQNQAKLTN